MRRKKNTMDALQFLREARIRVDEQRYSVYKLVQWPVFPQPVLALLATQGEFTAVALEGSLPDEMVLEEAPGWRLLSFQAVLPFTLTGFLAAITQALSKAETPVFALSSYDTDHILVPNAKLDRALSALEDLGCVIGF